MLTDCVKARPTGHELKHNACRADIGGHFNGNTYISRVHLQHGKQTILPFGVMHMVLVQLGKLQRVNNCVRAICVVCCKPLHDIMPIGQGCESQWNVQRCMHARLAHEEHIC